MFIFVSWMQVLTFESILLSEKVTAMFMPRMPSGRVQLGQEIIIVSWVMQSFFELQFPDKFFMNFSDYISQTR